MHYWGDPDVPWADIDDAAYYIGKGLRKWRVDVRQWKEKFGTVRVYCSLGIWGWHQLAYPGYVHSQWPKWLWKLSLSRWTTWPLRPLNFFVIPFHKWLYRRYYAKAVQKWPHIREEILCCADFSELLDKL
jgi:hypothetical protein